MLPKTPATKTFFKGEIFFAVMLILSPLHWFLGYHRYEVYQEMFLPYLPIEQIQLRYLYCVGFKIICLVCGASLLFHRDVFRKFGILLCVVNVLFVLPWRHPYFVFVQVELSYRKNILPQLPSEVRPIVEQFLPVVTDISYWAINASDLLFALAFMYYFTRPTVRRRFN